MILLQCILAVNHNTNPDLNNNTDYFAFSEMILLPLVEYGVVLKKDMDVRMPHTSPQRPWPFYYRYFIELLIPQYMQGIC